MRNSAMGASIFQARINKCISTRRKSRRVIYVNTLDTTSTHVRIFWPASKILHSQVVASPHTHSSSTVRAASIEMRYDTKTLKIRSIAYSFRIIFQQKVLCDNITPSSVLRRLGRLSKDMRCWPGLVSEYFHTSHMNTQSIHSSV